MPANTLPSTPRPAVGASVLIVSTFLSESRASPSVSEEVAQRLLSQGWTVMTTSDKNNRLMRLFDMLRTVWQRKDDYNVALVEVYSGPAFMWAEAVCWLLRRVQKPYALALHGGNLPAFSQKWPRRVARLLTSAHSVTTPSDYLQKELHRLRSDIALIPNPIAIEAYPFKLRHSATPRLMWLRAFHQLYDPMLAINSLSHLVAEFPTIELVMIGPDKGDGSLQKIRQACQTAGLNDNVRLIEGVPKSEVGQWLEQGDIFLNTTTVDNMPVSVIEAMACGLCIVSTDVGGIPYLLQNEHTALLVPSGDADAMAQAIKRIIGEPLLAQKLSDNAHRNAEGFDWDIVFPAWEALLMSTAGGTATVGLHQ